MAHLLKYTRENATQNLKASLMSSTRALLSDEARCFNQSERSLYMETLL